MTEGQALENARRVSRAHADSLLAKANVVGVGVGYRQGSESDLVLVVMVDRKLAADSLDENDLVPGEIEGIQVEVRAVGEIRAQGVEEGGRHETD